MIDFTKPVRTKSGHAARILCTDLKTEHFPIAVAVHSPYHKREFLEYYTPDGAYLPNGRTSGKDLENIPEEPKRHPHADVIIAWANGAEIEYRTPAAGKWIDIKGTPFWGSQFEYRVKPKEEAKADNDGWIEWKGVKCPVNAHQRVHIRYRCGLDSIVPVRAGTYDWSNYNDKADYVIVAYKVVK